MNTTADALATTRLGSISGSYSMSTRVRDDGDVDLALPRHNHLDVDITLALARLRAEPSLPGADPRSWDHIITVLRTWAANPEYAIDPEDADDTDPPPTIEAITTAGRIAAQFADEMRIEPDRMITTGEGGIALYSHETNGSVASIRISPNGSARILLSRDGVLHVSRPLIPRAATPIWEGLFSYS